MCLIQITPVDTGVTELVETARLRIIKRNKAGVNHVFFLDRMRKPVPITETPQQIFALQNTGGQSLGMLMVTETVTGDISVIFIHTISMITAKPSGVGSVVQFNEPMPNLEVDETLATLIGYQTPQVLNLALVIRASDSIRFIFNLDEIDTIKPDGTGSYIRFATLMEPFKATQSVAAIFAAQP